MAKSVVTCYPYKSKKIHKNNALKKYLKPGRKQMLNSKISKAVRLALVYGAVSATAFAVNAEEAEEKIEKIEVTGSSIKGTDLAGALPVNILSEEDIKATGVTSVPDLVAQIPSMQGFTTPVSSVGGGGGGTATAALRGLDEEYTLVLLNGRRIAPFGSTNTVDLNTIPLAAIERVEVLSDGASALYGSDAIAGVINFILKDEVDKSTVSVRYDRPQEDGGEQMSLSFTTGFGNFDQDGFSLVASLTHDKTDPMRSKDRDFAKTGLLEFEHNQNQYYSINGSPNSIPGNAQILVGGRDPETGALTEGSYFRWFTPHLEANGSCAPDTAKPTNDPRCLFDYTSTLEIYPETERTSLVLQADVAISEYLTGFATLTYTDFTQTPRIAPEPTGFINIGIESPLFAKYGEPHLTDDEKGKVTEFRGTWRALPGGNRTTEWSAEALNLITGVEGTLFDNIDFNTALVYSTSDREENILGGYYNGDTFAPAIVSGQIDIFTTYEDFMSNADALSALDASQWRAPESVTNTELVSLDFRASQPVFELPAGEVYVGYGADIRENSYENLRSAENISDKRFGDGGGDFDYKLERQSWGAFAEFQVPVLESLNFNLALRYDNVGAVDDTLNGTTYGKDENDTTYKVSFRYNATDDLVIRGSIGTGFKVASLTDIARPLTAWGVTGSSFTCPLPSTDSKAVFCPAGDTQYQNNIKGNPDLVPEQSTQSTFGFVYSPSTDFTFQMDYWKVEIEDQVQYPDQAYLFANADKFADFFFLQANRSDPTIQEVALRNSPINIGESVTAGIDWQVMLTNELSFGELKTVLQGTYITESEYTRPGVVPFEWTSSLGRYGEDEEVVFRNVMNIQNTLTHGDFAHTLRFSYKSGWEDAPTTVGVGTIKEPVMVDGTPTTERVQLHIPSYVKTDYKIDYRGFEDTTITFGINNLLDKEPPFSLADPEGHLVGYEGRYYDQFMRTYYISVDYSF
ncbi:TonB-dependent receptor domain-containing protein [Pseudoalteromonas sp. R3]|nr:TonB-dependent receptor [Pseudoalteromonas sp. R3]